jgi:hypothetical protein
MKLKPTAHQEIEELLEGLSDSAIVEVNPRNHQIVNDAERLKQAELKHRLYEVIENLHNYTNDERGETL